jgi:hypothetical protein
MGRACSTYGREVRTILRWKNVKERESLKDSVGSAACSLGPAGCLHGLLLHPEDGGCKFL